MRAFRVAYDGRPYHGFQRQPDVATVEDTLFRALRDLDLAFEDRPPGYAAAGRTDAGVSALAQTIAFEAPDWLSPRAFSAELPDSVRVWASAPAPDDFHATHHATYREYTYHLHAPRAELRRIEQVEWGLSGEHDFHNLSADEDGTVRDLDLTITAEGDFLVVRTTADGFPRQLVRRLVSLIDAVVCGDEPLDTIPQLLGPEPVDGPDGIPPAPAFPLVLTDVGYDLSFERDQEAAAIARDRFESRAVGHRTRARVATTIRRGL
jgi:tRNA pseudouridine38-40 synthase